MVSGGLMMVIHTCTQHHTKDVTTFSLINPNQDKENCCGTEDHECDDSHISTGCCDYKISDFNLSSFIASSVSHDNDIQTVNNVIITDQVNTDFFVKTTWNNCFYNKHGGRFIVNVNHQIIS